MDNMSMTLYWSYQCSFIFEDWTSQHVYTFLIGCVLSGLVAFLSLYISTLKTIILRNFFALDLNFSQQKNPLICQQKNTTQKTNSSIGQQKKLKEKKKRPIDIVFDFVYYLLYSTLHVSMMLLIMTMNGYVIVFILVGLTIGYGFTEEDKDKELPVNCCAC